MMLPINWQNERAIRSAFTYSTRYLQGPHFPGTPIGPYQQIHCAIWDEVEERARRVLKLPAPNNLRLRTERGPFGQYTVYAANVGRRAGWFAIGMSRDIYQSAEVRLRKRERERQATS
jgi:hypothetical protein